MSISVRKIEKWKQKNKIKRIIGALSNKDLEVRLAAIHALGAIEDDTSMNELITILRDPSAAIRAAAVEALGILGIARSMEFVRKVSTNDTDEAVRKKAILSYSMIKERIGNLQD